MTVPNTTGGDRGILFCGDDLRRLDDLHRPDHRLHRAPQIQRTWDSRAPVSSGHQRLHHVPGRSSPSADWPYRRPPGHVTLGSSSSPSPRPCRSDPEEIGRSVDRAFRSSRVPAAIMFPAALAIVCRRSPTRTGEALPSSSPSRRPHGHRPLLGGYLTMTWRASSGQHSRGLIALVLIVISKPSTAHQPARGVSSSPPARLSVFVSSSR